ncbi:hypothetical protein TrCOL_g104 [Triparma columacea]|uniref:Uncharacterized protein n=1 Tax=Triparma columacea TaxID=722753 RepID=A0A9W7GD32_9STRA|nr:hypothetical protein TrCOL_g104 [Triparma columacea]
MPRYLPVVLVLITTTLSLAFVPFHSPPFLKTLNKAVSKRNLVAPINPFPSSTSTSLNGWGPDPIFLPSPVSTRTKLTDGVVGIKLEYTRGEEFTSPGQYVQVRSGVDDADDRTVGYYAITSPSPLPSSSLDLVVKVNDGNGYMTTDDVLEVSQVMGSGFDGTKISGCDCLVVVCTGTGMGPCYSYLTSEGDEERGKRKGGTKVYWGTRDSSWGDQWVSKLEGMGVSVIRVYSGGEGGRYVQDKVKEDGVMGEGKAVMVVGQKGMFEDVKEEAIKRGVEEGRIFSNF